MNKANNDKLGNIEDIKIILSEANEISNEYFYFNTLIEQPLEENITKGKLSGYTISVKDAICVKDIETTGGSAILDGYTPVFDATVIRKIKQEGGIILGKTSQDAFGFGGLNVNVGIGKKIPLNPFDKERACGGSSGGCAGFTQKTKFKHISLAESTGGSIVCPASFCGVVGLCPTYGRVSRYGLLDYGNSLDKIGPMAKSVYDAALLLEIISGFDENESTSSDVKTEKYTEYLKKDLKGMKIGIVRECFSKGVNEEIVKNVNDSIEKLKSKGIEFEEVSLPITSEYGLAVYYIIAMCEASTNLAKYCGLRYGKMKEPTGKGFNEYFSEIRSESLNEESKRRIIIGTFARMAGFRDAYYIKAAKIRTKIIDEYKELFKKYDALISPTMPIIAPKFTEIEKMTPLENYMMDVLTVGPNLAGLPHITIPTGKIDNMPIGTMIIGNHFNEGKIIQIAKELEDDTN